MNSIKVEIPVKEMLNKKFLIFFLFIQFTEIMVIITKTNIKKIDLNLTIKDKIANNKICRKLNLVSFIFLKNK